MHENITSIIFKMGTFKTSVCLQDVEYNAGYHNRKNILHQKGNLNTIFAFIKSLNKF